MFEIKTRRYSIILLGMFVCSIMLADDETDEPIRSIDIYYQSESHGYTDEQGVEYYSTCPEEGRGIAYVSSSYSAGGTIVIPSTIDFKVLQETYPNFGPGEWYVDTRTRGDGDDTDNYKYYTSDVKCIGHGAFNGNHNVVSVELPNSITTIEYESFQGCDNLTTIKFGKNVKWVGDNIFSSCKSLKFVDLGESILTISSDMFVGCVSLESIEIPASVTTIEYESFASCSSLTDIKIPNSVVMISSAVFRDCSSLPTIVIPKNVERIGEMAFSGCPKLMDVYSEIEEPFDIPDNTFDDYTYENATLHVPQGTKSKYKNCIGWRNFKNIHESGEYDMTQLTVTVNVTDGGKVIFRDTEVRNNSKEFDVLTFFGRDLMFDIIPDEGYHIKSVTRNGVIVTDKLENENGVMRYIQYNALNGLTLSVEFEKDSQGKVQNVFTSLTPQGIEMTFKVLDEDQKLVQVGVGVQGQPAIAVSNISELIIPEEINGYKVAAIGEYAFEGFTNLQSVSIPWTTDYNILIEEPGIYVRTHSMWVRSYAFKRCNNLNAVTLYGDIGANPVADYTPYLDNTVFELTVFQNATLFVPRGYKEVFQSSANWAWCKFNNIVEHANNGKPEIPNTPYVQGTFLEYFIDKDPGYGKGTIVKEVATGNNDVEIDLTGVEPGAHVIYLRSHDENGHWSATISRPLYVRPLIYISEMEYYFDNSDPGQGKASKVTLPSNRSNPFEIEIPLGSLSSGSHLLNVRVKGDDGIWSPVTSETFTIGENSAINEVGVDREPIVVYALKGYQVNGQKGINIIRYKNRTTKKVIIK